MWGNFAPSLHFAKRSAKYVTYITEHNCATREANVLNTLQPKSTYVSTNIIYVDWAADGKSGSEVLSSLTSLPEWKDMQ